MYRNKVFVLLFIVFFNSVISMPIESAKVVYLIDKLDTNITNAEGTEKLSDDKYLAKHESDGLILADPIPADKPLPDGIYFKPAGGELPAKTKLITSPKLN